MKVAICGAGQMGRLHFDTFSGIEGVRIAAVADPDPESVGLFSEKGVRTFGDSTEMLSSVEADLAVIATPTGFHAPLAIAALERGMHVFCEKPMARTLEEGEAMVRAAAKAKRTLGIGHVLRFHDAYLLAREYMRGGRLGDIGTVRTSRCARGAAGWRSEVDRHGGAVFELLTHDLDWLAWSLGGVKRIFARGLARGKSVVERDYSLAVVRFESGAIGHLEGSLAEAEEFYASYEVAGTGGLLTYDTRKSTVLEARLLSAGGLSILSETPQNERPFARQTAAFVRALESGGEYEVSGEEGLKALRLTCAVYESIRSGRPVEP